MSELKERRKALGITQAQLAELVGVTQGAVAQWENGLTHPSFDVLSKLAIALHVTLDDLVRREEA